MTEQLQDLISHMGNFSEDIADYLNSNECLSAENRAYFNGVLFAYQDIQDMLVKIVASEMIAVADQRIHTERDT